jgi:hypothetical protein
MAFFRANDAVVALRQFFETWETISLIKTFVGFTLAVGAANSAGKTQLNRFANQGIHIYALIIKW